MMNKNPLVIVMMYQNFLLQIIMLGKLILSIILGKSHL